MSNFVRTHLLAALFTVAAGVVLPACLNPPVNNLIKPLEQSPKSSQPLVIRNK